MQAEVRIRILLNIAIERERECREKYIDYSKVRERDHWKFSLLLSQPGISGMSWCDSLGRRHYLQKILLDNSVIRFLRHSLMTDTVVVVVVVVLASTTFVRRLTIGVVSDVSPTCNHTAARRTCVLLIIRTTASAGNR